MKLSIRFLILCLIHLSKSDCVRENQSLDIVTEKKLHTDLECNYNYDNIPKPNGTKVEIKIYMKYFDLDPYTEIFSMFSWTRLSWIDERLKWDPKDYEGISRTTFKNYSYWVPALKLANHIDYSGGHEFFYGLCEIESSGEVTCVPKIYDEVRCVLEISNWPYDSQKCTLQYGVMRTQINVTIVPKGQRAVSMYEAGYGAEWTIVDYDQKENVSEDVHLQVTFTLERNGDGLAAILIFPSFLLTAFTLSTMVLDVKMRRFLLICFVLLCHFLILSEISEEIPKHSADPPKILLFYRMSLLSNGLLVISTFTLMKLRGRQSAPPSWIDYFVNMMDSSGKYVIWPRWETDGKVINSEAVNINNVKIWDFFANILNSVIFIAFVLVYSIISSVYIPRAPPLG